MKGKKTPKKAPKKEVKQGESYRKGYSTAYLEASKAFGGCEKCYGKGYSTQQHGVRVQIHTCVCPRGKQLDGLLLAVQEGKASVIV